MSSYPTTIVTFATHNDGDTGFAADINTPNAEIVAVETGLINGFQHNISPLNDNTKDLGDSGHAWKNLWTKGTVQFNNVIYTFPSADGSAGAVLQTNGSKTLSWKTGPSMTKVATVATGTQHDFNPGIIGDTVILCNNAGALTIDGFAAGVPGQQLLVYALNTGSVTFRYLTGSLAGNQLLLPTTSDLTLSGAISHFDSWARFVYDSGFARWFMIGFAQGEALVVTPQLQFGGASSGITYSLQQIQYRLVDQICHFGGRITLTSKGSSTGSATITGLPLAAASYVGQWYGNVSIPFFGGMASLTNVLMGYITPGTSTITLQTGGATGTGAINDTNFTNASDFLISGSYVVA